MVGTDDMKVVFRLTGTRNPTNKTFQMAGHEVGGANRPGALNGQVQSDGRIAISLGGLPVGSACQGKTVYLKWVSPYDAYAGGSG